MPRAISRWVAAPPRQLPLQGAGFILAVHLHLIVFIFQLFHNYLMLLGRVQSVSVRDLNCVCLALMGALAI